MEKKSIFEAMIDKECSKKALLSSFFGKEQTRLFMSVVRDILENFTKGNFELTNHLHQLAGYYDDMDWESTKSKEIQKRLDSERLVRFSNWLKEEVKEVVQMSRYTYFEGSKELLEARVDLLYKDNDDKVHFLVLSSSYSLLTASKKAAEKNKLENSLYLLIPKLSLNEEYKGIIGTLVFLKRQDEDKAGVEPVMKVESVQNSNVYHYDFSDYYENDTFNKDKAVSRVKRILYEDTYEKNCISCPYANYCDFESLDKALEEKPTLSKDSSSFSCSLTEEQERVADSLKGNQVVCACPGSGKTATLIKRTLHALKEYPSGKILVITFANKAADEIMERLKKAGVTDMPVVSTVHAHAWEICQDSPEIPLFNYSRLKGDFGLVNKIFRYIEEIRKIGNFDTWIEMKNQKNNVVPLEFEGFYKAFKDYCLDKHLYNFDDMVELVNHMFMEYPDVLKGYQENYDLIMVDEYQDVDEHQHRFIKYLANDGLNDNLCVFGDDDQNLYQFKGGSSEYMRSLASKENFKVSTLTKNFRSSTNVIRFSNSFVDMIPERILKKNNAVGTKEGDLCYSLSSDINETIKKYLNEGFSCGDIAILGNSNANIEKEYAKCKYSAVLERRLLHKTALVRILYNAAEVVKGSEGCLYLLFEAFGVDYNKGLNDVKSFIEENSSNNNVKAVGKILDITRDAFNNNSSSYDYVTKICNITELNDSYEEKAIFDSLRKENRETYLDLIDYLSAIVAYGSTAHVPTEQRDRVLFATVHGAKGREWPVVILLAGKSELQEVEEETLYRLYVAVTRAKENFCFQGNAFAKIRQQAESEGIPFSKIV